MVARRACRRAAITSLSDVEAPGFRRPPSRRTRQALRADALDEPVEDSRPDLVLADQVLDPMLEVRVVVDLDDNDFAVGLLEIDAVKAGADRARRLERRVNDPRRRVADRKRLRSALPRPVRPVLDDLPVAARPLILAGAQKAA